MRNLNTDLSELTTIPQTNLEALCDKAIWCICDAVDENLIESNPITEISIGIGKLVIKVDDEGIKYKFIPSKQLESGVKKVVIDGENPLTKALESSIVSKIINAYKDLF